jgi:hypothetical protein
LPSVRQQKGNPLRIFLQIILFIASFAFYACEKKEYRLKAEQVKAQAIVIHSLNWIKSSNAINDAKCAIEKDSIYFIGVYGFSTEFPGLSISDSMLIKKIPTKIIGGTGDMIISPEMTELNYRAREYALQFNSIILYKLKK